MQLALDTGGETLDFTRYGRDDMPTAIQTRHVQSQAIPIAPNQDATTWTFSVQRFEGEPDFTAEAYEAAMAEYGALKVWKWMSMTMAFRLASHVPPPEGLDVNQIQMDVMDSFREVTRRSLDI